MSTTACFIPGSGSAIRNDGEVDHVRSGVDETETTRPWFFTGFPERDLCILLISDHSNFLDEKEEEIAENAPLERLDWAYGKMMNTAFEFDPAWDEELETRPGWQILESPQTRKFFYELIEIGYHSRGVTWFIDYRIKRTCPDGREADTKDKDEIVFYGTGRKYPVVWSLSHEYQPTFWAEGVSAGNCVGFVRELQEYARLYQEDQEDDEAATEGTMALFGVLACEYL